MNRRTAHRRRSATQYTNRNKQKHNDMIEIKDISFGYPGTGKSTLLYLISGLLHPTRGTVLVDGMDTRRRHAEMLAEIFLVPEEFELPKTSLDDYVLLNRKFYPRFSMETLTNCLRDFELPLTLELDALSMGQKKKVFMSFALAAKPSSCLWTSLPTGLTYPRRASSARSSQTTWAPTAPSSSPHTRCTMWSSCSTTS